MKTNPAWNRNQALPETFSDPGRSDPSLNALLAGLRGQLRAAFLAEYGRELSAPWVNHALREAEALAFLTPFPALVLPALAQEKISEILQWLHRQRLVRERNVIFFAA